MRRITSPVAIVCLAALLGCSDRSSVENRPPAPPVPTVDGAAIERIVESFREKIPAMMEEDDLAGMAVALVDRAGPLWVEGFGYLDRERRVPVDERTIFSMQSTSKTVTATAALVAVRAGLVDLDTPVQSPDASPHRHAGRARPLCHAAGFAQWRPGVAAGEEGAT